MRIETAMYNSSVTGEKTVSSHVVTSSSRAVTFYGIPVVYIVVAVLLILAILYLFCRVKRRNCHHFMKKSSYIKLFIALFVPLFIYNLYNFYNSSWFYNTYTKSWINYFWFTDPIFIVISASTISLMESIIPYLFITLSMLTINCYRKSS
jgi:hypothetical protein